jgi:hypothetical protein
MSVTRFHLPLARFCFGRSTGPSLCDLEAVFPQRFSGLPAGLVVAVCCILY